MEYSNSCLNNTPIISTFILFFLLFSSVFSATDFVGFEPTNQASNIDIGPKKTKPIKSLLAKINKPYVKSIKSADGDTIDCVLFHLQPAFDLYQLKGNMKMDQSSPEMPKGIEKVGTKSEVKQLWNSNGEFCPNGTIPIRRTRKREITPSHFGMNVTTHFKKTNSVYSRPGHEHTVLAVKADEYYGAQAVLNVWAPSVAHPNEFSTSQIWVIADSPSLDLNTIEAGWQVYPQIYGDNRPRLFIFWTNNGYQSGCYNLQCSGFVQTTQQFALGGAISSVSTYDGEQFEITVLIWKDQKTQNWWLKVGEVTVGYWPSALFPQLQDHATTLEFGGEVFNSQSSGPHTSTQMGSGHFANEGVRKASYIKNINMVDRDTTIRSVVDVTLLVEQPNCYDAKLGFSEPVGDYIYFGGPGKNPKCP